MHPWAAFLDLIQASLQIWLQFFRSRYILTESAIALSTNPCNILLISKLKFLHFQSSPLYIIYL